MDPSLYIPHDEDEEMRGGHAELVEAIANNSSELPDLPKEINIFRNVISDIKDKIFSELDKPSHTGDKQSVQRTWSAVERIKQVGNILKHILEKRSNSDSEYEKEITPIIKIFNSEGIDFGRMSPEIIKSCIHYVVIDIDTYPFRITPTDL